MYHLINPIPRCIFKTHPRLKNIIAYKTNSVQPNRNPRHWVCGIKVGLFFDKIIYLLFLTYIYNIYIYIYTQVLMAKRRRAQNSSNNNNLLKKPRWLVIKISWLLLGLRWNSYLLRRMNMGITISSMSLTLHRYKI